MNAPILILGAGPGGLTAAYSLLKMGYKVVIIEKDNCAGGLMRAVKYRDFMVDLGYKHLYNRITDVQQFWETLLGNDFLKYVPRIGVLYNGRILELEKSHRGLRRGMPYNVLFASIVDLLWCRYKYHNKQPVSLEEYAYSRRGRNFTQIFSQNFDEHFKGHKWSQLPVPHLTGQNEAKSKRGFFSRFMKEAKGTYTKQDIWYHPAMGTGQIIEILEREIKKMGGEILFGKQVSRIAHQQGRITTVIVKDNNGETEFTSETVVSCLPLPIIARLMSLDFTPSEKELSFRRGVVMVYLFLNRKSRFPHTYLKVSASDMISKRLKMSRITNFGAYKGGMVPKDKGCLCVEYFCSDKSDIFSKSDEELLETTLVECERSGLIKRKDCDDHLVLKCPDADPAGSWEDYRNDSSRKALYEQISNCSNLYQINRTGTDKSTYAGLLSAKAINSGNKEDFTNLTRPDVFAPWEVEI